MITDDQLLLYYYRELDAGERARIAAALAEQPELSQRLHRLIGKLDAAAASPEIPVPAATQQRWRDALDRAGTKTPRQTVAQRRPSLQPRWPLPFGWAAAAGIAAVALVIGYQLRSPTTVATDPMTAATPSNNESQSSAYERGLQVHLASTERQLVSLGEATPEERARLVAAIIDQNRMFALAAERAGEPQLARVLRAFAPVLESVAEGRGDATANGIDQLSFEFRVMQARLGSGADSKPHIY
jgi:hypothetical protein